MGDIAEGLLNGDFDSVTGEYIGEWMGFPRSMYDDDFEEQFVESMVQQIKKMETGIRIWMRKHNIQNPKKVTREFCIEKLGSPENISIAERFYFASTNFHQFASYASRKYKNV